MQLNFYQFLQNFIDKCLFSSVTTTKKSLNTSPYFSYIDIVVHVQKPRHLPDFPPILIMMVSIRPVQNQRTIKITGNDKNTKKPVEDGQKL